MNKNKILLISALSGLVMTGAVVLVLANSHIDIFPCTETVRERDPRTPWEEGRLVRKDGTCSLMDELRDNQFDPAQKSELTGAGWAMLVALALGIGIGDTLLLHTILSKTKDKAPTTRT
jgi:hypothetical protein